MTFERKAGIENLPQHVTVRSCVSSDLWHIPPSAKEPATKGVLAITQVHPRATSNGRRARYEFGRELQVAHVVPTE